MPQIFIAGEDEVSKSAVRRIAHFSVPGIQIFQDLPARGGKLVKDIPKYNVLANSYPGLVGLDLDDAYCPPEKLDSMPFNGNKSEQLLINIAVTEAESWLLADREGLAEFLGVRINEIPEPESVSYDRTHYEIPTPVKPSLFLMLTLADNSKKSIIRKGLTPVKGAKKGQQYNSILSDFISRHWDITRAIHNSTSLFRCVQRIRKLFSIDEL